MADKTLIKAGHLKITDHLILGISQSRSQGNFENFTLETSAYGSWNQITNALKGGEIDVAFMLAPTAMDLFASGVDIKLLMFAHKTGSVLIKNKAANIQSVSDLKGKVIAIPFQLSVHHMLIHQLLREHGLEPGVGKDVALEVMAPAEMPQAIQFDDDGEFGGYIVAEPFGSQAVTEGFGEEFYLSKDLWPKHPCCVVMASQKLIDQNPDAVQELTNSLVSSGNFIDSNLNDAVSVGAQFLGQQEAVVKKVLTEPADRVMTTELMPVLEDLEKVQDYMHVNMNLLKSKIDLEKFVDSRFAQSAGAK